MNAWEPGAPSGNQWNEEHDLWSIDFDPKGAWDVLEQSLTPQVPLEQYAPNENTLYLCDAHGAGGSNVYAIRVYDLHGNYADCAILSDGVQDGVAMVLTGQVDEPNPVTRRAEITDASCSDWTE